MVKSPCVRILVVDDSPIWRTFLMGHLKDAGLKALYVAYDGVQAVAKAQSLQPDVILMDISLPRLNGIQAAAVIRNVAPKAKIVFVSGNTDPEVRRAALRNPVLLQRRRATSCGRATTRCKPRVIVL